MIVKFLSAVAAILLIFSVFVYKAYNKALDDIKSLTAEKICLNNEIIRRNKNAVETSKRIEELEREAKKDTSFFNWNADISNTNVVKQLRKD